MNLSFVYQGSPAHIVFGEGSSRHVGEWVEKLGASRALVLTTPHQKAEGEAMATFHHQPGPRSMIGVAPALYRRWVFDQVGFDAAGKEVSDDADFCYRLAQVPGARFGIGRARVMQEHAAGFSDYVAKFAWYGRRDAGFCLKHPERAGAMFFQRASFE